MSKFRCEYKTPIKIPSIINMYSRNAGTAGSLSHTFTNKGKFQYFVCIRLGDTLSIVDPIIKLNENVLTPYTYFQGSLFFYYGEINVDIGDIITLTESTAFSNSGMQLIILNNIDVSKFNFINARNNDNTQFNLPKNKIILEVFKCGYYRSNNNYNYSLIELKAESNSLNDIPFLSVPVPNEYSYWYGFTYCVSF